MHTEIFCNKCRKTKPISDFYKSKINSDGETGKCKRCVDKSVNKWKQENPKVVLMYLQKARKRDPAKHKEMDRQVYLKRKARQNC